MNKSGLWLNDYGYTMVICGKMDHNFKNIHTGMQLLNLKPQEIELKV